MLAPLDAVNLNYGVTRCGCNATVILSIPRHFQVALVSPGDAPRVLNDPVLLVGVLVDPVPDNQHGVVQPPSTATGFVVHTLRVKLERLVTGVDRDWHRSDGGRGSFQTFFVPGWDVDVSLVRGARILGIVPTLFVYGLVRVGFLGVDAAVFFDVLERVVHDAAAAAIVAVLDRAVDEVLFAQGDQLAGFAGVLTLQRSGLANTS